MLTRRQTLTVTAAAALLPQTAWAFEDDPMYQAQLALVFGGPSEVTAALDAISARGNTDMIAGTLLALRFTRAPQLPILEVLAELAGEAHQDWFDWMLWQERHPEITPHPSFPVFFRNLHLRIDRYFADYLDLAYLDPAKMKIRLEEITWGGVIKDGIPSLDNPDLIAASDARYMRDDDLVFGVSINGDVRAYPLRIMGWHEMFNEVIGGVPVALAYCTLCGSGILFETAEEGQEAPHIFGSSGFLYRSNKLMFDRETQSLWNQFTGKPVSGPLVDAGIELRQRPVVIATWADWTAQNPKTKVLSVDTGFSRDYGSGVVYSSYFGSPDLMFPAQVDQSTHKQKDYVFGIRQFGANKAWPLKAFEGRPVINDAIGSTPLVLLGDPAGRTVRAYERGELVLSKTETGTKTGLTDNTGRVWEVTEEALIADGQDPLPRVAGHIAYWFAWNNYMGLRSEVFEG